MEYLWKHRSLSNLGLHCPVYYPVEEAAKTKTSIKSWYDTNTYVTPPEKKHVQIVKIKWFPEINKVHWSDHDTMPNQIKPKNKFGGWDIESVTPDVTFFRKIRNIFKKYVPQQNELLKKADSDVHQE